MLVAGALLASVAARPFAAQQRDLHARDARAVVTGRRVGYRATVRRVDLATNRNVVLTFKVSRAAITVAQVIVTGSATASERRGAQDVASLGEADLRASGTASLGRTLEKLPGVSSMGGGPALGGWVEGNPSADAERSSSVEGGVHYTTSRANVGIVGYRNTISNFTYLTRSTRVHALGGNLLPVFSTVQARARLTGLEPALAVELRRKFVLEASYARIVSRNVATGEQLPLMPADLLRGSLRFAPKRIARFELPYAQLGFKYAWGKRIAGPTEPFADGGSQGYGIGSTPAYSLLDLGVGGQLAVGSSAVEFVVTVDNAPDTTFRDFLDSQKGFTLGLGRNVGIRVAVPLVLMR